MIEGVRLRMACNCGPLPSSYARLRPTSLGASPPRRKRISSLNPPKMALSPPPEGGGIDEGPPDPVKAALSKAAAYRKEREASKAKEVPDAVKLAMDKAREYKMKNKGGGGDGGRSGDVDFDSGLQRTQVSGSNNSRDGTNKEKSAKSGVSVSSIDFVGLKFSDKKKSRGPPPGLAPPVDPFPQGNTPEVEIIVGDASKFGNTKSTEVASNVENSSSDLYKPKVSTWGVFPRPENISRTFGGGRNIRPGEELETAEVRAAREAHSRELIARYKKEIGLNIDANIKSECEKALKDGDLLMDKGKLREALPYYEKVMKTVVFQSELHGLAALQWSICQDSLSRQDEARMMYEKLQTHPNIQVSKKAKLFMFGFQAMEKMKISRSSASRTTGYENYFEALLDDKTSYTASAAEQNVDSLTQALPYIFFILSPILFILTIVAQKGVQL